jgi:DNA-binding winged helix-turn-helix (wHTH) protein
MQQARVRRVIRFGVFQLDLESAELRKHGVRIKLQGKPSKVLEALLDAPHTVVTREELRRKLWPGDTFVDFDNGLNTAVKRLRIALGDSAENPRFIETLSRTGYRFIAPLSTARQVDSGSGSSLFDKSEMANKKRK